jgi:hypothetical protein
MIKENEQGLNEAFEKFIDKSFMQIPIDNNAPLYIVKEIMGCGTTIDVEMSTFSGWEKLINRQIEQAKELNYAVQIPASQQNTNRCITLNISIS